MVDDKYVFESGWILFFSETQRARGSWQSNAIDTRRPEVRYRHTTQKNKTASQSIDETVLFESCLLPTKRVMLLRAYFSEQYCNRIRF